MDVITVVWICLGLIALLGLGAVAMLASYKHKIRIKQTYGNKNFVIDDKFKEVRKKEGVYWRLLKSKITIAPAPDEAVEVTKKGRMTVTAYEVEKGTYVWQKDDLKEHIKDKAEFANKTQPLTTTQRALYMNQLAKAEREKKKTTAEVLAAAVPIMALVILVVVVLLFWGDAIAPIQEAATVTASVSEDFKAAAQAIAMACNPEASVVALNSPIASNVTGGLG
jgi:hypothetical protein